MRLLQDILARHPVPGIRLSEARRVVAQTLSTLLAITVRPESVRVKDGVCYLSLPPAAKTEAIAHLKALIKQCASLGVYVKELR